MAGFENKLNQAFSPSSPIREQQFFQGRFDELQRVVDALNEVGQHVIVYGERGVGKTSFANIVATKVRNLFTVSITCSSSDNFAQIWRKALGKVRFERTRKGVGFLPGETIEVVQLDMFLKSEQQVSSGELQGILENLEQHLLFIFDEYDTISDRNVHRAMAETIKNLSDNARKVSVMIVGVGASINDLLQEHKSIDRCLAQVRLNRMADAEIKGILEGAEKFLDLKYKRDIKNDIVAISSGFPHFAHLLGKLSARSAFAGKRILVDKQDLEQALCSGLERADETTRLAYQKATFSSHRTCKFQDVLMACAVVLLDEHLTFRAADAKSVYRHLRGSLTAPRNFTYYLNKLTSPERGHVLEKIVDGRRVRYRFRNPFVRAYCRMKYRGLPALMEN